MAKNNHGKSEKGGLQVQVVNNNIEQAIRRLKKKISNDGIMIELREKQQFTSNTEKRIRAEAASTARHRRRISQQKNS
jgi:small subunit ribosomal protein S21